MIVFLTMVKYRFEESKAVLVYVSQLEQDDLQIFFKLSYKGSITTEGELGHVLLFLYKNERNILLTKKYN